MNLHQQLSIFKLNIKIEIDSMISIFNFQFLDCKLNIDIWSSHWHCYPLASTRLSHVIDNPINSHDVFISAIFIRLFFYQDRISVLPSRYWSCDHGFSQPSYPCQKQVHTFEMLSSSPIALMRRVHYKKTIMITSDLFSALEAPKNLQILRSLWAKTRKGPKKQGRPAQIV